MIMMERTIGSRSANGREGEGGLLEDVLCAVVFELVMLWRMRRSIEGVGGILYSADQ